MFFIDETGHEFFADKNFPIFGYGGCAALAADLDDVIVRPWQTLKRKHFSNENYPLHASQLPDNSSALIEDISKFFRRQRFFRFGASLDHKTQLPENTSSLEYLPSVMRNRWQAIALRCRIAPTEIALIHESSQRGDKLLERYFGVTQAQINGKVIPVHHALIDKKQGLAAQQVADFIAHAVGTQANHALKGRKGFRKDFEAVFHVERELVSYLNMRTIQISDSHTAR